MADMQSDKPVRIGVIGFGHRGKHMAELCLQLPQVEWVAACDMAEDAEERAKAIRSDVAFYVDFSEMLDSGVVNTVIIETPPELHATCAIAALRRGINVLSDVPAVHTLDEAPHLLCAAEQSRAVYMLGENANYWGFVEACFDLKQKGLLGAPVYLEAEYVHNLGGLVEATPWRKHYEPIRYCTHSLGPVLKWIGGELTAVSCYDTGVHVHSDPDDHDAMVALFRTRFNVVVKVLCTFINRHPHHFHRYVYYGTKGYFERTAPAADGKQAVLTSTTDATGAPALTSLPVGTAREGASATGGHGGADRAMLDDFVSAIINGRPSPIGVRDALRMTLPGLYALESASKGGELVRITYPWNPDGHPARSPGAPLDELAVLRYCSQVLNTRMMAGGARAWQWESKRKLALYFIRILEHSEPKPDVPHSRVRLSETEKDLILRSHPLLQETEPTSTSACLHAHCEWYDQIRDKVNRFSEAWKQDHGATTRPAG
jgi:predicted dehydrogenase